jgi:hypothetical protein
MYKVKVLTNAQIKSLPGTAVTIIAAPGANYLIRPIAITLVKTATAGAYTGIDTVWAELKIVYNNANLISMSLANDNTVAGMTYVTDFLAGADDKIAFLNDAYLSSPDTGTAGIQYVEPLVSNLKADLVNKSLDIRLDNNGSLTDLGGGNVLNNLRVIIHYDKVYVP